MDAKEGPVYGGTVIFGPSYCRGYDFLVSLRAQTPNTRTCPWHLFAESDEVCVVCDWANLECGVHGLLGYPDAGNGAMGGFWRISFTGAQMGGLDVRGPVLPLADCPVAPRTFRARRPVPKDQEAYPFLLACNRRPVGATDTRLRGGASRS